MRWAQVPKRTRDRLRWLFFWTAVWSIFAELDLWRNSKRDGSTFSQTLRDLFRTDTHKGRVVFLLVLSTLSTIFAIHIVKE